MNILDLEEFEILEKYKSDEGDGYFKFVVKAKNEPMFCSKCGAFSDDGDEPFKLHDTRPRTVKDVDLRGAKVIIEIKQRRYNCPHCGERFTEFLESVAPDDKVTRRLWEHMGVDHNNYETPSDIEYMCNHIEYSWTEDCKCGNCGKMYSQSNGC